MNMNEEMNAGLFLSLLTPRSFLMLILSLSSSPAPSLWSSFECGFNWMNLSSQGQRTLQQGWCIAYFSFSLGSQNEHACYLLYWTFDQAFYPCRIGTNHHCIALEQLSSRRPATSVHRYIFILRTWSNLTTLRGLVRSQSSLVRRNWTKKRECSTGRTANKDRNYIEFCSSPSLSLRLVEPTVWRLKERRPHLLVDSVSESHFSIPR